MEEMLDLVNEQGEPIGQAVPRSEAHRLGLRHRTSHVWLVRRKNGMLEVLLQKRSDEKDSFPGCYDISSAGHIPAGQGFVDSALRELKEELGVTAQPQDLILCGQRSFQFSAVFHGKPFKDNQVSMCTCSGWTVMPKNLRCKKRRSAPCAGCPLPTVCVMWRTAR